MYRNKTQKGIKASADGDQIIYLSAPRIKHFSYERERHYIISAAYLYMIVFKSLLSYLRVQFRSHECTYARALAAIEESKQYFSSSALILLMIEPSYVCIRMSYIQYMQFGNLGLASSGRFICQSASPFSNSR